MHERGRTVVVEEAQEFGPSVVADRVHHPLALGHEREVHVGDQDALAGSEGVGKVLAFGRDDGGAVAASAGATQPLVRADLGHLLVGQPAGGVDHEAGRSRAWWRIVTSIWSAKIWPTREPGNWAAWISS